MCKSHGTGTRFFRARYLPRLLVLFEIHLADENREEGDSANVEDHPGNLNAEVHADWRNGSQYRETR